MARPDGDPGRALVDAGRPRALRGHVQRDALGPDGPGPANFVCGVLDLETFGTDDQTIYVAASAPYLGATNGGPPAAVSGAATVRVREGSTPGAVCFPDTGTFQFFKPLNVSFTRIDSREKRVASPLALGRQLRSGTNPFGTTD
jgi:hypothetical protein